MTGLDLELAERTYNERRNRERTTFGLGRIKDVDLGLAERVYQERREDERKQIDQQHALSISQAFRADPVLAAEAQELAGITGTDALTIEKNIGEFRRVVGAEMARRAELVEWSPNLVRLLTDPRFARVVSDDIDSLSLYEQQSRAARTGQLIMQRGELAARLREEGPLSDADLAQLEALERQMEQSQYPGGFLTTPFEFLGQMSVIAPRVAQTALATGIAFGGTTMAAGTAAPMAPAAAGFVGLGVGATAELFRQVRMVEGGSAFAEMLAWTGPNGEKIDQQTAASASRWIGNLAGALEVTGVGVLTRSVAGPVRQALVRRVARNAAAKLSQPRSFSAEVLRGARNFAGTYLGVVSAEVGTEIGQEVIQILGEDIARVRSGLPAELGTQEGFDQAVDQVGDIIVKTVQGMALLGAVGPSMSFASHVNRTRRSQAAAEWRDQWFRRGQETKTFKRSKSTLERMGNEVVRDTPRENVYVEAAQLAQSLEDANLPRTWLQENLPGVAEQMEPALKIGGDVVIPSGTYNARIVGTDLDGTLRQHTRSDPDDVTPEMLPEAEAATAEMGEEAGQAIAREATFNEAARAVEAEFERQVRATRRAGGQVAQDTAAALRAFVETQGTELGLQPEEIAQAFNLQVERGTAPPAATQQPPAEAGAAPAAETDAEALAEGVQQEQPEGVQEPPAEERPERLEAREGEVVRAAFDPERGVITLFEGADVTSILHELSHAFLHWYGRLAESPAASQRVRDNFDAFLDWRGIEGGVEAWNALSLEEQRPHHEAFAEAFEVYASEGQAPSEPLKRVFANFRRWITRLWRNLRGEARTIAPEIRQVFDRMLASEQAIEQTAEARGLTRLFEERPEGISDAEWESYLRTFDESTEATVQELSLQALGDLQAEVSEQEQARVRAEVAQEVANQPVYRALDFLRRGRLRNPQGQIEQVEGPHKLRTDAVRDILTPAEGRPTQVGDMELLDAVAALGGLRRSQAQQMGVDPAEINARRRGLQLVFPRRGRTLDAIREALVEEGFSFADVPALTEAIERSLAGQQVFSEQRRVGRGELLELAEQEAARRGEEAPRIDLRSLRITTPDGLEPDQVAPMFGYPSGEELVQAVALAPDFESAVDAATAQRLLDERAKLREATDYQRALDEAFLSAARSRLLAAGLKVLTRARQPVRAMVKAARDIARESLAQMPVNTIKPWRFQAAEARFNREAAEAVARGDIAAAINAQRNQLLQHEAAREAVKVEEAVRRAETLFTKFFRTDRKLARYRDVELVMPGRALLRSVGFRPEGTDQQRQQEAEAIEKLREDFAVQYDALQAARADFAGTNYRRLLLAQFQDVTDVASALWDLSRTNKLYQLEGRKLQLADVTGELGAQVAGLPRRLPKGARPPQGKTPSLLQRGIMNFWSYIASTKRFQHWSYFMDGLSARGPFQELLLRPMLRAINTYRDRLNSINGELLQIVKDLQKQYGRKWDADIYSPELDFTFRGVRQLFDVVLDLGNESNKAKRFVGEGWSPDPKTTDGVLDTSRWDRFFESQTQPGGVITPELMEAVSKIWQFFETLRPEAQATHKLTLGYEFKELELTEVRLPWGTIRGGYAPVRVDQARARNPRVEEAVHSAQGVEQDFQYSRHAIGVSRNFTMERNPNYYDALTMDIGRRFRAFDEELRYIYLQPQVRNVLRVVNDREFAAELNAYDRDAINQIITPWVDTVARQTISRPSGRPFLDAISNFLRRGTGVAYLGLNMVTALVQFTGLSLTRKLVGRRYYWAGVRTVLKNPRRAWADATARSSPMRRRLDEHEDRIRKFLSRQSLAGVWRGTRAVQDAAGELAWLPIRLTQGMVDIITWHAAYQQSLAESPALATMEETEAQAVQDADLMVERAQGSGLPEAVSKVETGTPQSRLWFQFLSFSNVLGNQVLMAGGMSRGKARAVANMLWFPAMLTLWETAIREPLEGLPEDEDNDGVFDELAAELLKNYTRNVAGMVPIVGPAAAAFLQGDADRVSSAPAISAAGGAARTIFDLVTEGELDWRGFGTVATILTGIPIRPVGERLDYLNDVATGDVDPTSQLDFFRGIVTGRASEASR